MSNICVFDIDLAVKYGLNEAILIQNLFFWHKKNVANNNNFFDGSYWSYNSVNAWLILFPYMSRDKIKNSLKKLEDENIIISGNYNENKYDQTKWYAFSEKGLSILHNPLMENTQSILQNPPMEERELPNGVVNIAKCLNNSSNPVVNTVVNTLIKDKPTKVDFNFEGFSLTEIESIKEWIQYKKEKKDTYTKTGLTALRNKMLDMSKNNTLVASIQNSIASNWKGLFESKITSINKKQELRDILHNCNSQETFGEEF